MNLNSILGSKEFDEQYHNTSQLLPHSRFQSHPNKAQQMHNTKYKSSQIQPDSLLSKRVQFEQQEDDDKSPPRMKKLKPYEDAVSTPTSSKRVTFDEQPINIEEIEFQEEAMNTDRRLLPQQETERETERDNI